MFSLRPGTTVHCTYDFSPPHLSPGQNPSPKPGQKSGQQLGSTSGANLITGGEGETKIWRLKVGTCNLEGPGG